MRYKRKSITLIIAIMMMLIFALLGTTLLRIQATRFAYNRQGIDSEKVFYLAESGAEWGMEELTNSFDCDFDRDGMNISFGTVLHSLGYGQYRVDCNCDNVSCSGDIKLTSTGFVSQESGYRAMRRVKLTVSQGAFDNTGSIRNILDWSGMLPGSAIDGDLVAGSFNRDGDGISEACKDYGTIGNCGIELPPGSGKRENKVEDIPPIDMAHYENEADNSKDYSKTAKVSASSSGENLKVTGSGIFDNSMDDEPEAVRIVGEDWSDENWVVIKECINKKEVKVYLKGGMDMSNWRLKTVRVVKRFAGTHNNDGLWYIKGGDILIDVRGEDAKFKKTSLIAEGDIIIKGSKGLSMDTHVKPSSHETFPNLATEGGNIYSKDLPDAGDKGREFKGLIYSYSNKGNSEKGDIWFNCISGKAVIGYNVTLEGQVQLKYDPKYVDMSNGFLGNISIVTWREK